MQDEAGATGPEAGSGAAMSAFTTRDAVLQSRAQALHSLLAAGEETERLWRPEELAAIFRHQMTSPILLESDGPANHPVQAPSGAGLGSFGELLRQPSPPAGVLLAVKDFAKAHRERAGGGLPPEIASALYYLCLAAARARLGRRMSQLTEVELRRGWQVTLAQPWLDEPARELIQLALDSPPPGGGEP